MSQVDSQLNTSWSASRSGLMVVFATVLTLVAGLALAPQAAFAGPGSLVGGVVWADTNRDGVRDAGEPLQSGATVELLTSPGGLVVATTTTSAVGAYSFAGSADGSYIARVTAPGAFIFPATSTGANDFVRAGQPAAGQPERGVTAPFAIAGVTQVTALDAGLQPIANLQVEKIALADACDGFALTGTPPFDATDEPGQDSGTKNCIVRTEDTVAQQYGVSLTGLPGGVAVPNVVVEFTISSTDAAKLKLVGPSADGLPAGCLTAANGANPPSSRTLNADGSITVLCNIGTMTSNVGILQLSYQFAGDTPIPSHASISARAYAAGGQAGAATPVSGPVVEVTGTAQWELEKVLYTSNGTFSTGPSFDLRTIDGVETKGYLMRYQFNITDLLAGAGGSDLVWPVTFTDVMPEFPNARIDACRPTYAPWEPASGTSQWTLTCPPLSEAQGADGWKLSIKPNNAAAADSGAGHMVMDVFIPLDEMNRAIDTSWQPGEPTPAGKFDFENKAKDTEKWAINGGALNFGDGHESGWDGTGNNLVVRESEAKPPRWDLQKNFRQGPTFVTETIDGEQVDGYTVDYDFRVLDLAGAANVAPWLDLPVTFKDRLVSHPGAILLHCRDLQPNANVASTNCETGAQPADGWDISATPNRRGFEGRRMDFIARIFIPLDEMAGDICQVNVTLDLRNEATASELWTVDGQPNNPTGQDGAQPGYEPGWDGTTATGNNLAVNKVRPSTSECGSLAGNKAFIRGGNTIDGTRTFGGDIQTSFVSLTANNNRVKVDAANMALCDVFDVSVFELQADTPRMAGHILNYVDPADYVIEYAVGPNDVDTQAGPLVNGYYPIDRSSLTDAAAGCRDDEGPWSTDPAADFGPDWQDDVNMVRIRPIDPAHVEVGDFAAHLIFELETRTFYNGGPNDGELIPSGVRVTNIGGWPTGVTGQTWTTVARERVVRGMELVVAKTVTPTQYLPGATAVWDLDVQVGLTTVGATLRNLRVVDTIPENLHFDAACTQALLPPGVTVSYDSSTRQATFLAGDIPIVTAGTQWVFEHSGTVSPRLRICTRVDTLAQPLDTLVNRMQAMADNAENAPTAQATITVVGSGQLGVTKSVDKPFVASGETYTWTVDWGNTSTEIAFQAPDIIDVLPWNGDGDPASGSARTQYESDYTGLVQLNGPLAAPTYVRGGTGVGNAVAGTWYYTTADPSTLNHDARHASNANPAAAGGPWQTAAETTDFAAVTGVRFVSSEPLPQMSRVRSLIPMVSTSSGLNNVYVNRAMIYSATFPNQPLLSTEPYVLMPGFTLGDLVWVDGNGNGRFDAGEQGVPGVTVQVRDGDGDLVATEMTNADGRWSVAAIPAGEYTVHIPAAMFAPGGPLAGNVVRTVGSSGANDPNESADNNNTAAPEPATTGLTSTPVTLSYDYLDGDLVGGDGPSGDDVAGLSGPLIPDGFTTFTVDLAVMPAPAVDVEKSTNGQDADEAPGPSVAVDGDVRWAYVVTNTGGVDLTNVTVTDDQVASADIDCDGTGGNIVAGPLAPDASFTCVATGTAIAGQYENLGAVTGLDPTQVEVSDDDPSHYFGVTPAVGIEKATNGRDADETPGPNVTVGGEVRWTYVVTNTGNAPLTNVTVTDDLVAAADIDCDGTGGNIVAGPLAPDASFTCVASGTATTGQYANLGTVTGLAPETTDVDGNPIVSVTVTDDDPSHYFGIEPAVDIEKATNGQDADETTGPQVAAGGDVRWTYVVTNTGDTPLTDVTVTDDLVEAADIECDATGGNVIDGPLAPGATFTCVAVGTAVEGQYANLGTVSGTGPETADVDGEAVAGATVTDEDPSHYFGVQPSVDIEKATNGQDADEPTGPSITVGGEVRWTYVVTNTGNVPLTNVIVTDDQVAAAGIDCDATGGNVIDGPLEPGATFTCVASGTATAGQYANVGTVLATGPETTDVDGETVAGETVTDEDPSHYFGGVSPVAAPPVAAPPVNAVMARTGWDAGILPIAAGAVVLGGLVLMMLARRRRRDSSAD